MNCISGIAQSVFISKQGGAALSFFSIDIMENSRQLSCPTGSNLTGCNVKTCVDCEIYIMTGVIQISGVAADVNILSDNVVNIPCFSSKPTGFASDIRADFNQTPIVLGIR